MLVNICVKFHEETLTGFKATEQKGFCDGQSSKGHNSTSLNTSYGSYALHVVICMKFHENTLNGFQVTEQKTIL